MSFVATFSDTSEVDDPFQWKPGENLESTPQDMIGRLSLKIEEKSLEEEIEFESVILHMALSYEHFIAGNVDKSREILQDMMNETTKMAKLDESGSGRYRSRLVALRHLLSSALTHVLIHLKDVKNARKEFEKMELISSMDAKSKAALSGFRATFYAEYGIYGSKAAIAFAAKAIEMDGEESLWYFIKGKLFGRVRRVENPFDIPSPVELEALETASEKESNAAYAIFTAEVYRETANRAFRKHIDDNTLHPNLKQLIDKMNEKSLQLYKQSMSLKPHCAHIKFRCAKGFMKLPRPFRDTDLAKKCTLEGLKMAPTSAYGHHVMAAYYERHEKDIHAAVRHLKICVPLRVYGAAIDLLRLDISHFDLSRNEILQRLDQMYEGYVEPPRRCQTLSQYVSYYLFVDYVLEKAIDYLVQIFRLNSSCEDVRRHRSLFLRLHYPISLLEVLVDEMKIRLNDANCSRKTRDLCNGFLAELDNLRVDYPRNRPRYLRQACLAKSAAAQGAKASRKGVARGRSSVNATVSYLQRRQQQAAADQTLGQIDRFTNSWKEQLGQRQSSVDGGQTRATPTGPQVDEDSDEDRQPSPPPVRPQSSWRRPSDQKSSWRKPSDQRQSSWRRPSDQEPPSLDGLAISKKPGNDRDSDFEESVLAYRRAKQAADSGQGQCPAGESRPQSRSAAGAAAQPSRGRQKPKSMWKSGGDDRRFDNYLARSTVEMRTKFEPAEVPF